MTQEEKAELQRSIGERVLTNISKMIKEKQKEKKKWYRRRYLRIGWLSLMIGLQDGRYEASIGIDNNVEERFLFWIEFFFIGLEYEHGK